MSTLDFRDLPEERLATTDAEGNRIWIIPARVRGKWKNRKRIFHIILLAIFVLTPWLRWNGEPLVLLDLSERQFIFFGKVFGAHDGPIIFFVLGILGFGLIIATALWGRVWCGWACPQTVFIEQVFRRIETLIVGNRAEQIACRKDPFKPKHLMKTIGKWVAFFVVSTFLAHTFISYFVSWEKLLHMMSKPPAESWTVFLIVSFFTGIILFDFAWFREQFCIIMCPYGRFQSVLMDQNSVTVAYDYKRGEPRGRNLKDKELKGAGDCIDCYKCVSVCPTGIDIRNGQQLECVACTACIDACDEVMEKIKRPKGLIRYAALADIEKEGRKVVRPRMALYGAIMLVLLIGFTYVVNAHRSFYISVLRQNKRPYAVSEYEGQQYLINNYRIHVKNPLRQPAEYKIRLVNKEDMEMAPNEIKGTLAANQSLYLPFFIRLPLSRWQEKRNLDLELEIQFQEKGEWVKRPFKSHIVGP